MVQTTDYKTFIMLLINNIMFRMNINIIISIRELNSQHGVIIFPLWLLKNYTATADLLKVTSRYLRNVTIND